jgi:hypothetical protein
MKIFFKIVKLKKFKSFDQKLHWISSWAICDRFHAPTEACNTSGERPTLQIIKDFYFFSTVMNQ